MWKASKAIFKESAKFSIVGVMNTIAGLFIIYSTMYFFGFNDATANISGYSAGMVLGFILNKNWTFRDHRMWHCAFLKYIGIFILSYFINLSVVLYLTRNFAVERYAAQALGIVPYTISSFLFSKYFVFKTAKAHSN